MASRPEGCTTDDIRAATGWTKTGGFNHAIRRAGLTLRKVREGRTMRYFAERTTTTAGEQPRNFDTLDEMLTALNLSRRSRDYFATRTATFA